jgi:N-acetylglucosaminyldiphosphoundecaprenol N-acetyl-beta-D-mannosaminyltransferase
MSSIPLGEIRADAVTQEEAIHHILHRVDSREGGYVVTPNVDHICLAENDVELRQVYRESFLALADGQPLLWMSSLLGEPLPEKVSGSDLVLPLLREAAAQGRSVYFLGSTEATCALVAGRLRRECPGLLILGWSSPSFDPAGDPAAVEEALARVRAAQPDLLLVAMGSPKQEYLMSRYLHSYAPAVAIGIGAGLDFLAGTVRRSPAWMSRAGLEWLFRLAHEPRRLAPRYLGRDRAILSVFFRTWKRSASRRGPSPGSGRARDEAGGDRAPRP